MEITTAQIKRLAYLARLAIDEDDIESYRQDISRIIQLVDQLQQVDTSGVTAMSNPHHAKQRLREDVVTESDQHELFQQSTDKVEDGLYLVPKVIEDQT